MIYTIYKMMSNRIVFSEKIELKYFYLGFVILILGTFVQGNQKKILFKQNLYSLLT